MTSQIINKIDIAKIQVGQRLRAVDEAEVEKIAISLEEVGQINPIDVRPQLGAAGEYVLIAGAHRLAAAKGIGWLQIDAVVFEGSEDGVRRHDRNLRRAGLVPAG